MNISLSVIIANYNNQQYIAECLNSIIKQTYRDLEIIVVDDCSTDTSPDIIKSYASKYPDCIKAIYQKENRGVSSSRHAAIVASRGRYITTLDSDDYYFNAEKLEKEMAVIDHHLNLYGKDICVFSNTVLVQIDGNITDESINMAKLKEGNILEQVLARTCVIPRDFIMLRSAYFDVGGFDQSINLYEDWDLKIRLASKFEFYYSGVYGTAYRRHGGGLSGVSIMDHVSAETHVFNKNIHLVAADKRAKVSDQFAHHLQLLAGTTQ